MKEYRLGDIIDIKHGYAFDGDHIVQEDNGIVLVTPGNFRIGGGFQEEKCKFFTGEIPDDYVLSAGDFIVTMTDLSKEIDTLGYSAIVPDTNRTYLHNQRIGLVSFKNNECHPGYIYFLMRTHQYQRSIANTSTGATVHHTSPSKICDYQFYAPSYEKQRRIAEYLFVYEKLTENNQKQIKLLEEAAQRLYKEWFVDLRFPGHETTPIVDGVPVGWSRKTVEECLSFHGNGGWGKETSMGKNEHPGKVIRGTDIEDVKAGRFNDIPLRYHTDNDIKKRTLKIHDLVFELSNGNINNIGRCLLIDDLVLKNCGENTICASFCKLLRPVNRLHSLILYWEIQDMQTSGRMLPLKKHGANGINNFDFDGFLNHELLIPDNACMLKPIEAIMAKISIIQGQFALLTEARDRLLPKLMNGELEV